MLLIMGICTVHTPDEGAFGECECVSIPINDCFVVSYSGHVSAVGAKLQSPKLRLFISCAFHLSRRVRADGILESHIEQSELNNLHNLRDVFDAEENVRVYSLFLVSVFTQYDASASRSCFCLMPQTYTRAHTQMENR